MKIFFLLISILLINESVLAATKNFNCRGWMGKDGNLIKYNLLVDDEVSYRSRLQIEHNEEVIKNFPWMTAQSTTKKFQVSSPWPQYKAYMRPGKNTFDLIIVDANTSNEIEPSPVYNFYCYLWIPN